MKKKVFLIFLLISALLGAFFLLYATDPLPAIGGDATIYITSARNLLEGKGLGLMQPDGTFRLIPYFPPGYSLCLALLGFMGGDLVGIARWLNILLFGCSILLWGLILYQATARPVLSWLGASVLAVSPFLLILNSWAMSEPLAIFLGFLGLYLLGFVYQKKKPFLWLTLSAVSAGVAMLTRYNAVAFILAGVLYLIFNREYEWKSKFVQLLLYCGVSFLPNLLWSGYSLTVTHTLSSRRIELPVSMIGFLKEFWLDVRNSVLLWILPDRWVYGELLPGFLSDLLVPVLGIVLFMVVLLWQILKKKDMQPELTTSRFWVPVLFWFSVIFFGFNLLIRGTTYPPITINGRMLSPLYIIMVLIFVIAVMESIRYLGAARYLTFLVGMCLVVIAAVFGWQSKNTAQTIHEQGMGYTAKEYRDSDLLEAIKQLPSAAQIVTNQDMLVLFWTGRLAYPLKEIYQAEPLAVFVRYGDGNPDNDQGQALFKEKQAVLVLFDSIHEQLQGLYREETAQRVQMLTDGLEETYQGNDGGIYIYP